MIALVDVTKSYQTGAGRHLVLDRVSMRFPTRARIGILGVNGAGKSTLLRILGGAELPDSGVVRRKGRISWPLGFSGGLNGALTGEENCRFVARVYDEDLDSVTDFAQGFAELGEYFFMPVRTYSSGMRARLSFGLSMAIDFDTYLVDEVTAVGDERFRQQSRAHFRQRGRRAGIIMVSHQMATIREYCDQCAVLSRGQLDLYDDIDRAERAYKREAAA